MGRRPKSADAPLTPRQRRVLEVINDSIAITGYPPSIREIGNVTGLQSTSSVAYQLRELEKKGYLRRDPQKPRALDVHSVRPVPKETRPRTSGMTGGAVPAYGYQEGADLSHHVPPHYIPVIGQVAAGDPILAHQDIEEFFPMPATVLGGGEFYMLRVVGESMRDAGILPDDWVVVRAQVTAEPGDYVIALIDGEATVKEFHRDDTGIWLIPHNPAFEPIPAMNSRILGKVVSVFRKM